MSKNGLTLFHNSQVTFEYNELAVKLREPSNSQAELIYINNVNVYTLTSFSCLVFPEKGDSEKSDQLIFNVT